MSKKAPEGAKNNEKKKKKESPPDNKICYLTMVMTAWYNHKDRQTDQWTSKEPETDTHIHYLFYDEDGTAGQSGKNYLFNKWC